MFFSCTERKYNSMNNILITLLLLFLAFSSVAQTDKTAELVGKKFKTDVVIGSTDYGWSPKIESVNLTQADIHPWGYFLQLNDDGSFIAFNQNSCGNDCRVKVSGTYKIENGVIEFVTNTIRFMDICAAKPKQEINSSIGSYKIKETGGRISLVRVG